MLTCLLVLAAPAAPASPQTTWIVDRYDGPGSNFTEVQPAIDVAAPGDTVLVRAGNYGNSSLPSIDISKGLTLIAEGSVSLPGFSIQAVPEGEVLQVLDFRGFHAVPRLEILGCTGTVHLQGVDLPRTTEVFDCSDVRVERCKSFRWQYYDAGELQVAGGSRIQVVDCTDELDPLWASVEDSELLITGSHLRGTDGSPPDYFCWGFYGWRGAEALALSNSARVVVIDSEIVGGYEGWGCYSGFLSGIAGQMDASSSIVECRTNLVTDGARRDTFAIGAGSYITERHRPSLAFTGSSQAGGTGSLIVRGRPGSASYLLVGNEPASVNLLQSAPLLMRPTRKLSYGIADAQGERVIPIDVPLVPSGTALYAQSVQVGFGGERTLSNAVTVIVRAL